MCFGKFKDLFHSTIIDKRNFVVWVRATYTCSNVSHVRTPKIQGTPGKYKTLMCTYRIVT